MSTSEKVIIPERESDLRRWAKPMRGRVSNKTLFTVFGIILFGTATFWVINHPLDVAVLVATTNLVVGFFFIGLLSITLIQYLSFMSWSLLRLGQKKVSAWYKVRRDAAGIKKMQIHRKIARDERQKTTRQQQAEVMIETEEDEPEVEVTEKKVGILPARPTWFPSKVELGLIAMTVGFLGALVMILNSSIGTRVTNTETVVEVASVPLTLIFWGLAVATLTGAIVAWSTRSAGKRVQGIVSGLAALGVAFMVILAGSKTEFFSTFGKTEVVEVSSRVTPSAERVLPVILPDTFTRAINPDSPVEEVIGRMKTLDVWFDSTQVESRIVQRGPGKVQVLTLKEGAVPQVAFFCRYTAGGPIIC